MSNNDVRLAIEGNQESFIQEIALNGQETWIQPLSMAEKLQLATQKIDFFKELEKDENAENDSEEAIIVDEPQENPWDPIRKNIADALQEVRVLHDVLAVLCHNPTQPAQQQTNLNIPGILNQLQPPPIPPSQQQSQKYLTLAGVSQPDRKPANMAVTVYAKKKALSQAGSQIIKGSEHLTRPAEKKHDFHQELLLLRQHYRLRRVGDKILGDVSFRTCGSRYHAQSTFEVSRDTENEQAPLKVRLPPELKSTIWISVRVEECKLSDTMSSDTMSNNCGPPTTSSTYQYVIRNQVFARKYLSNLKRAQDGLYCQELFSQLCREAATFRPIVPIYVMGNKITTQIFPDTKFIIELHRDEEDYESKNPALFGDNDRRWFCLEQLLNKMLREQHDKYTSQPPPHPTIATLGMTRKQRTAVTKPYNRSRIMKMNRVVPLLQQIIEAAKHCEMVRRIEAELDSLAKIHYQPNIHVHWPVVQNQVHTSLKIHFSCSGYEMCTKQFGMHSILLNIGIDKCQAVQRDGSVIELGADPEELRRLMEGELLAVQISCLAGLSRIIDWTVLSSRRGAILLAPPVQSECVAGRVAVRTEDNKIKVFVETRDSEDQEQSDIIIEPRWKLLHSNQWKEVDWEKIPGLNFVAKMEQMLACLANEVSDII